MLADRMVFLYDLDNLTEYYVMPKLIEARKLFADTVNDCGYYGEVKEKIKLSAIKYRDVIKMLSDIAQKIDEFAVADNKFSPKPINSEKPDTGTFVAIKLEQPEQINSFRYLESNCESNFHQNDNFHVKFPEPDEASQLKSKRIEDLGHEIKLEESELRNSSCLEPNCQSNSLINDTGAEDKATMNTGTENENCQQISTSSHFYDERTNFAKTNAANTIMSAGNGNSYSIPEQSSLILNFDEVNKTAMNPNPQDHLHQNSHLICLSSIDTKVSYNNILDKN